MMKFEANPPLFPEAMGVEEETGMMVGNTERDGTIALASPIKFIGERNLHIPITLSFVSSQGGRAYLQNGGMVYDGGYDNLERVTPECVSPEQTTSYIQSNEDLLIEMAASYISRAAASRKEFVRIQRRVITPDGKTKGNHDNFGIGNHEWLKSFNHEKAENLAFLGHFATRSFMTGAGLVAEDGLHFAQKASHLSFINYYGYQSSVYRNATGGDTGSRLEIRCNDINISPWANRVRLGATAMMLASLQTPLRAEMAIYYPKPRHEPESLDRFVYHNMFSVNDEYQLLPDAGITQAIDFQERMSEIYLDKLGEHTFVPDEYYKIALEINRYCQDFRKLLSGELNWNDLANRSDVAAKFAIIASRYRQDKNAGIHREPADILAQQQDMLYDYIKVSRDGINNAPRVDYGYGYRLRDRGKFATSLTAEQVTHAFYKPPEETRAKLRGDLIAQDALSSCDWSKLCLRDGQENIHLYDVTSPLFPQTESKKTC